MPRASMDWSDFSSSFKNLWRLCQTFRHSSARFKNPCSDDGAYRDEKSLLYPMLQSDAAKRKTTSSMNACAAKRNRESTLARALTRPPKIAPITSVLSAVDERATDNPETRAVANQAQNRVLRPGTKINGPRFSPE